MGQYLLRNHETRKYLQEQAYRLQQGIVTTTTQQAGAATHTNTHFNMRRLLIQSTSVRGLCPVAPYDLCPTSLFFLQMMDRMCVKVQDHLNSLRYTETDSVQEDMKAAENLMKDARKSKTVKYQTHRHKPERSPRYLISLTPAFTCSFSPTCTT